MSLVVYLVCNSVKRNGVGPTEAPVCLHSVHGGRKDVIVRVRFMGNESKHRWSHNSSCDFI